MKRRLYATLADAGDRRDDRHDPREQPGATRRTSVSAKNISLDRNPLSSGTPAIAAAATMASVAVIGIADHSPLSCRMSRDPVSWSMIPAAMNSDALNAAWFMMWKTPATTASGESRPNSSVMSPRWLIVEYASRPLRSCWKIATKAPKVSVARPTDETIQNHGSLPPSAGYRPASRKTPAFTMVAECR